LLTPNDWEGANAEIAAIERLGSSIDHCAMQGEMIFITAANDTAELVGTEVNCCGEVVMVTLFTSFVVITISTIAELDLVASKTCIEI
jgi:hypothetical protein